MLKLHLSPVTGILPVLFICLACNAFAQFSGGTGTEADPYQVSTPNELNNVRNYLTSHFLQVNDINLYTPPYNQGTGWASIGTYSNPFAGTYDGNGFAIINLVSDGAYARGLFYEVNGAVLKNINLIHCTVDCSNPGVGGLVGYASFTDIHSCRVIGSVSAENTVGVLAGTLYHSYMTNCSAEGYVHSYCNPSGGLAGKISYSQISDSYSNTDVNGSYESGGFVGYCEYSTLNRCWSMSSVNSDASVGGFAGYLTNSQCTNCYAKGNVSATGYVGGFCAYVGNSDLTNCYSTGHVNYSGSGNLLGGFAASGGSTSNIVNCYWDTESSGTTISSCGIGRTTLQMTYPYSYHTYMDWDFSSAWHHDDWVAVNGGYPYLQIVNEVSSVSAPFVNPRGGYYDTAVLVSLVSDTPGSQIYFTTDGSEPTRESALYVHPFYLAPSGQNNVQLKAIACKLGSLPSPVITEVYDYPVANNDNIDTPSLPTISSISPNPFVQSTEIAFSLPKSDRISLSIYNQKGQLVKTLSEQVYTKGEHTIIWDGTDIHGRKVSSGIYLLRMQGSDFHRTGKLMLMR
jgi:hypothetical protein